VYVQNGLPNRTEAAAGLKAGGSRSTEVKPITAKVNATVSPASIYSTDTTNSFTYTVRNDGFGTDLVAKVRLQIPSQIVSLTNVSSTTTANITIASGWIVLDYGTTGSYLRVGKEDKIRFRAIDNVTGGAASILWNCQADFDNGLGWINGQALIQTPDSRVVSLVHPPVLAQAFFSPGQILTAETPTNRNLVLKVVNSGAGNNAISCVRATLTGEYLGSNRSFLDLAGISASPISINPAGRTVVTNGESVTITMPLFAPIASSSTNSFTFPLMGFKYEVEEVGIPVVVEASNGGSGYSTVANASFAIFDPNKFRFRAGISYDDQANTSDGVIYSINDSAEVKFLVENRSSTFNVSEAYIGWDFSVFSNLSVESKLIGPVVYTPWTDGNGKQFIRVAYPSTLPKLAQDEITLKFDYLTLTNTTSMTCALQFVNSMSSNVALVGRRDVLKQTLKLEQAWWGKLRGTVFPLKPINIRLYTMAGAAVNAPTNATGGSINLRPYLTVEQYELRTSTAADGTFTIDYIPPGMYKVKFFDENGKFMPDYYLTDLVVATNTVTNAPQVTMLNALFNKDSPNPVETVCYEDDELTKLVIQPGTMRESFSAGITIAPMSSEQMAKAKENTEVAKQNLTGVNVYDVTLLDVNGTALYGTDLLGAATMVLHYQATQVANKGWSEADLAVFFWDAGIRQWVKAGGEVDQVNKTVSVDVGYINSVYVILPAKNAGKGKITDVSANPNPFTPMSQDRTYNTVRITFTLADGIDPDTVFVNIFNMKGELIRKLENRGGVWAWDGFDQDAERGQVVSSGVYIYQIRAGKETYSGTILLVK
jgi:hypothetical protein